MAIGDWFTSASSNTDCDGTFIGENCAPGNLNDAIRKVMAAVRTVFSDFWLTVFVATDAASARTALGAATGSNATNSIASITPAVDTLPYYTGTDTADKTPLTAFARTLLDDVDAPTARATLVTNVDSIGIGQTWQNVTGSRTSGATYTNATAKPIMLKVIGATQSGFGASILVDGIKVGAAGSFTANNVVYDMGAIVPPGSSYVINYTIIDTIAELR